MALNREARYQIFDNYDLHFGTRGHSATIQVNFDSDIVNLDWKPLRLGAVGREELDKIRWLEIGGEDLQHAQTRQLVQIVLSFPSLEQVALVSPNPTPVIPGCFRSWIKDLAYHKHTTRTVKQADELLNQLIQLAENNPQVRYPNVAFVIILRDGTRDYSSAHLHRPAE